MLVQAFNIVVEACMHVWDLFVTLRSSFGFGTLLFNIFVCMLVYRFLLQPLFGAASSDLASSGWKKIKGRVSSRKSSVSKANSSKK